MRITIIILIFIYLSPKIAVAQSTRGQLLWKAKEIKMQTAQQKKGVKFSAPTSLYLFKQAPGFSAPPIISVADDFYNQKLGWVCKQEWKMEQRINVPIRFRLGSREQVDYLEGKQHR